MTMTNAFIECILSRSAAKYYDPAGTWSDEEFRNNLMALAKLSARVRLGGLFNSPVSQ
jgi:hypothetical protein